jgi:hypothetical protein
MALRIPLKAVLAATGLLAGGLALWLSQSAGDAPGVVLAPGVASANLPNAGGSAWPVTSTPMPEHLLAGDSYKTVVERIRARHSGQQPLFRDDQAFAQARAQQVLFAPGVSPQTAAQSPLANERRLQDGREWISYDMRVLAARAEGDQFLLPMPDAAAAQAEIDTVELVEGQYRWSGRVLGQPGSTFTITQAFDDQYAVGAIRTPWGEYLLEAKNGTGWLVESGKEFFLPPDGNDTVSDDGSHLNHSHQGHKH